MYADKIYPAIYGKEYEEPVQTTLFDMDELDSTADTLSTANKWRQQSTRFQPGNEKGVRFASNNRTPQNQLTLDMEENPDDIL